MANTPQPGIDWNALIGLIAPAVGTFASRGGGGDGAFMQGYQQSHQRIQQERQRLEQERQRKATSGADYLLKIGEHAQGLDDPIDFQNFLRLAEDAGTKAGYVQPGELSSKLTFSPTKQAEKQLKELADQLDGLMKQGYDLNTLADSGQFLETKSGKRVPVGEALKLTRRQPLDASGQAVAPPKKQDVNASTDFGRFLARWAKDRGKTVEALTATEELDARKTFNTVDDKPAATPKPTGEESQLQNLVNIWKLGHPGKEPPDQVMIQLRKEAYSLRDNPPAPKGGTGTLTDEGVNYAATQYRITGVMPALGMGNGEARSAIINGAAAQAKALGQSPVQAIQKQAAYKSDASALTQMRRMSSAAEAFETKATQQIGIVSDLSKKVSRTNWPIINDALLAGKANIVGDSNTQLLYNALATFTAEYAKIMEGSTGSAAGSSDSARRAAERLVRASLNDKTLQDTLALMQREMDLTVEGYGVTIDHITTRMGGAPMMPAATPTPAAPTNIGPSYQDYLKSKQGRGGSPR